MPKASANSMTIQPPKGLSRLEKAAFRDGIRQYFGDSMPVSALEIDGLIELIRAKSRAAMIQKMLDGEVEEMEDDGRIFSTDLVTLVRQADATAKLIVRLADRLRAPPR